MEISRIASPAAKSICAVIRKTVQNFSAYSEKSSAFYDGSAVMEFIEEGESEILVFHINPQGAITDYQVVDVSYDSTILSVKDGHGDHMWSAIQDAVATH